MPISDVCNNRIYCEHIGTPQKQTIPMYLPLQIHQIKQSLELHSPTKATKNKDRYKYIEVPSEYSVYEYRLFLLYFYMKKAVWLDYYYKERTVISKIYQGIQAI